METLYDVAAYPTPILKLIEQSEPMGVAIANRWMIGWPERVQKLLVMEMYEDEFQYQVMQEREAMQRAARYGLTVTQTEAARMSGLSLEPPEV